MLRPQPGVQPHGDLLLNQRHCQGREKSYFELEIAYSMQSERDWIGEKNSCEYNACASSSYACHLCRHHRWKGVLKDGRTRVLSRKPGQNPADLTNGRSAIRYLVFN